jgi:FtsH-binding integral membrane protein
MNEHILIAPEDIQKEQQRFIVKVYGWMAFALAITGLVALYTATSAPMIQFIFGNTWVIIGLMIVKLLMVGSLAGWVHKMSVTTASVVFVAYSILTGFVFAGLFLMYTAGSIGSTFLITGGIFAIMSAYGYFTGNDLTRMGNLLIMLLVGLILASVVNLFMQSTALYWISTYVGVFVFTGLIAYDTQKLKEMNVVGMEGTAEIKKAAILGALSLYLDFINLFLMLLRIFGSRK